MADNPFAQPSTLPFQMPPFDRIHDSDYLPAFEAALHEQLAEVAAIAHNPQPPTFENTVVALERSGQMRVRIEPVFSNLNTCNTDPQMQKIDTEMAPRLTAQDDAIFLDAALWARVERLYQQRASAAPRSRIARAADALSHAVRARRCASASRAADAAEGAEQADLIPHHPLQAERAQGHRRRRRGGG